MRFKQAFFVVIFSIFFGFASPQISHASDEPVATDPAYDLKRDLSDCVSSNPLPDCGRKPTSSGDRGGAMQYATFGAIVAGLAIIFTVVFRNVIRADRNKAANLPTNEPGYF